MTSIGLGENSNVLAQTLVGCGCLCFTEPAEHVQVHVGSVSSHHRFGWTSFGETFGLTLAALLMGADEA